MEIIIGSDHGGFDLKQELLPYMEELGHTVTDKGCYNNDSVDYPDYAKDVCNDILNNDKALGILICGTGIGISMAANRNKGIRAALCTNEYMAEMTRRHNNANILCLGGRNTTPDNAKRIVEVFLKTAFDGDRHQRRIDKLDCYPCA